MSETPDSLSTPKRRPSSSDINETLSVSSQPVSSDGSLEGYRKPRSLPEAHYIKAVLDKANAHPDVFSSVLKRNSTHFRLDHARRTITGMGAIHIAARRGNHGVIKVIQQHGGRTDLKCWSGLFYMSPIHLAAYFAEDGCKAGSLNDGGDWVDYKQTMELLLNSPQSDGGVNDLDGLKRTALHWAAEKGSGKGRRLILIFELFINLFINTF